jgi:hypothetical protein
VDTGAILALISCGAGVGILIFGSLTLLTGNLDAILGVIAGACCAVWLWVGIAALFAIHGEWTGETLPEKVVMVETYVAAAAFALAFIGGPIALLIFGPPYYAWKKVRRWRRIEEAEGRTYDEAGIRIYKDDEGERYFPDSDQKLYPISRKVCWWEDEDGHLYLCKPDGSDLKKKPKWAYEWSLGRPVELLTPRSRYLRNLRREHEAERAPT